MIIFPRIALRKKERFGCLTLIINTRNVETGIVSVSSLTGEDKPMRVAAPVMIAFAHLTVHRCQRISLPGLQVHHPQISIWLHDREIASAALCIHQPFSIIRRTSQDVTHIRLRTIQQRIHFFSKLPRFGIERNTYQRALHFQILSRYTASFRSTII